MPLSEALGMSLGIVEHIQRDRPEVVEQRGIEVVRAAGAPEKKGRKKN